MYQIENLWVGIQYVGHRLVAAVIFVGQFEIGRREVEFKLTINFRSQNGPPFRNLANE